MHLRNGKKYDGTRPRTLVWYCVIYAALNGEWHCNPLTYERLCHYECRASFKDRYFKNRFRRGVIRISEKEHESTFVILSPKSVRDRPNEAQKRYLLSDVFPPQQGFPILPDLLPMPPPISAVVLDSSSSSASSSETLPPTNNDDAAMPELKQSSL